MAKKSSPQTTGFLAQLQNKNVQVAVFMLVFGLVGGYFLNSSFAATQSSRRGTPTLMASPNPAHVNDTTTFSGCGYEPNAPTSLAVQSPTAYAFGGGLTDASGCIDSSKYWTFTANQTPGTYTVKIWQDSGKGGSKQPLVTTSYQVIN